MLYVKENMPSGFMYRNILESEGKQNVIILYFITHMPIFAVNLDHITTSKYYAMLPFLTLQKQSMLHVQLLQYPKTFAFCPHSIFMDSVRFSSEQTALCSLDSLN
jgi:hypothetical protein